MDTGGRQRKVHHRLAKVALGIVAVAALPTGAAWAQNKPAPQAAQQESPYKDQGEYDLAVAAQKETDPQKQLDRIKEWEQKYPDSKLKGNRTFLQANALMKIAGGAYGKTGPADVLDGGAKAAQQVLDNFDTYFSEDIKKALGVTDDQWKQAKGGVQIQAHNVLGWVAQQKKDWPKAEGEYKKLLEINPNDAQSAYWLGTAIIAQKNVDRYSEAIYEIAHALSITGTGALPAAGQQPAEQYLSRVYGTYHGNDIKDPKGAQQVKDDIAKLKTDASGSPFPPAGFHIKNANEIAQEQFKDQAAFDAAHPDIALWRTIRTALTAADGDTYFEKLKDSLVPPAEIGMLKAKIVTVNDKELVASVDNATGDVTLKFEKALNQKVLNPGDAFEFKGVVASYTKEPYMLTVTIDDPKESIKGLPDNSFSAAPVRRAPVRKKK
jgi:tetratricopeptide (TPR) repeat protein